MRALFTSTMLAALVLISSVAMAHTPLFSCYDNGDGTITCEGGFSDGSSAAGVRVFILDGAGNTVKETKLDEFSEITIKKPSGDYAMKFDAGEGHRITVPGKDIVE